MYDYEAQTPEELSIKEGQTFYLYDQSDPDWWWGIVEQQVGLVPSSYVDKDPPERIQETNPLPVAQSEPSPSTLNPTEQKNKLLNALDGFGFANPVRRDSNPKLTPQETPMYSFTVFLDSIHSYCVIVNRK